MYQLFKPKFRFGLFVTHPQNSFNIEPGQPLVCFADSYEIKEDGSIIFYQTAKNTDDKKFKIPVLAYPSGRWETCIFLDEENEYPAFQGEIPSEPIYKEEEEELSFPEPRIPVELSKREIVTEDTSELDDLDSMLGSDAPPVAPNPFMAVQGNPQELKKLKASWLEKHIKDYVRTNENFDVEEFLQYLESDSQNQHFKTQDIDVIWAAATLIRDRMVLSRKFANPLLQKMLGLILPDIMRRQWDGKMAPILEVLQDREETKNATAIDLAVWMSQNNFS